MTAAYEFWGETERPSEISVRPFSERTIQHLSRWVGQLPGLEQLLAEARPEPEQLPVETE